MRKKGAETERKWAKLGENRQKHRKTGNAEENGAKLRGKKGQKGGENGQR